jgi:hypothetical protein
MGRVMEGVDKGTASIYIIGLKNKDDLFRASERSVKLKELA